MSLVEPDWRMSPFTRQMIDRLSWGSRSVSMAGPSGQNVSKPLALVHWPSQSLQITSRHVVGCRVAENVGADVLDVDICSVTLPITTASSASWWTSLLSLG